MGFLNDYMNAKAMQNPAYAKMQYDQQQAKMQAQALQKRSQWMNDNRESMLGRQPQLGLPSNMPMLKTKAGTGAYAQGIDPMQKHLMERNFTMGAAPLAGVSQQGFDNSKSMQGNIMSGVNAVTKTAPRKTLLGADKRHHNVDDGSLVFPGIQAAPADAVDPTSNMRDMEYFKLMPDGTDQEKQEKALFRNAISKGHIVDQGTHFTDLNTGTKYDKNIIAEKTQEGEAININTRLDNYPSSAIKAEMFIDDITMTISELGELKAGTSAANTGWAAYLNGLPESEANRWMNLRDTITSRFALDKMMELKNASPTGSTGFGALNEKEMEVMQDYLGNLAQAQGVDEIKRIIDKIIKTLGDKKSLAERGLKESDKWYNLNAPKYRPNTYTQPEQASGDSVSWEDL